MKKIFSLLLVVLFATGLFAQSVWESDPMHSKLTFSIIHNGISSIDGLFNEFTATATTSKADFSDAVFELTAKTASINTQVEMRDNHLRSADFFEVEKYPTMSFKSTSIKEVSDDRYTLSGNLTIHGVTKPVTMDLWYRGTNENKEKKTAIAGFQLLGTIKRSDFNIGTTFPYNVLSDKVQIKADGEFKRQ